MHRGDCKLWAVETASASKVRAIDRAEVSARTVGLGAGALKLIHVKCFISCDREAGQWTGCQDLMRRGVQIFYFYAEGHTPRNPITKTFMNIAALASDCDSG